STSVASKATAKASATRGSRADGGVRPTLIHGRVGLAHLVGLAAGELDLEQGALANAGAPAGGLRPFAAGIQELRPEWEDAALRRFRGVDRTAAGKQEGAQGTMRHSQAQAVAGAVDVTALEGGGGHP